MMGETSRAGVTHQDPAITPGKALPPCQEQSGMLGWGDDV